MWVNAKWEMLLHVHDSSFSFDTMGTHMNSKLKVVAHLVANIVVEQLG